MSVPEGQSRFSNASKRGRNRRAGGRAREAVGIIKTPGLRLEKAGESPARGEVLRATVRAASAALPPPIYLPNGVEKRQQNGKKTKNSFQEDSYTKELSCGK
jgi:hypothetical protein